MLSKTKVILISACLALTTFGLTACGDSTSSSVSSEVSSALPFIQPETAAPSSAPVEPTTRAKKDDSPGYKVEPTDPDFVDGDFGFYRLSGTEVKVTTYNGSSKNVEIPASVQGMAVTAIERDLFNRSDIESVTIPNTVTEIGNYAFTQCQSLKEIVIPEGVKTIGTHAFWYCKNLEKVTLPKTVEKIDPYAFSATGVTSLEIPDGQLNSLSEYVFFQCWNLTEITIPQSVTSIDESAFADCPNDMVINAYADSAAATYAKTHGYRLNTLS